MLQNRVKGRGHEGLPGIFADFRVYRLDVEEFDSKERSKLRIPYAAR